MLRVVLGPSDREEIMHTAKLFQYGCGQAVRLPDDYRFEGDEVWIRRDPETGEVILSPKNRSFSDFLALRDRLLEEVPPDELENYLSGQDQS